MDFTIYILIIIFLAIVTAGFYYYKLNNKNKKDEERLTLQAEINHQKFLLEQEEKRKKEEITKKNKAYLEEIFWEVHKKVKSFHILVDAKKGYISGYNVFKWQQKFFKDSFNHAIVNSYKSLNLNDHQNNYFEKYINIYNKFNDIIAHLNTKLVRDEISNNQDFFSNIDGKSLDLQQRLAIATDEDNTLVVAGAGSGKTATIAGKVAYLVNKKNISPDDILLISFTKKASYEMMERIQAKMNIGVKVKTFNALGLEIIKSSDKENQKDVSALSDFQLKQIFDSFFEECLKDFSYFEKFTNYFFYEAHEYRSEFSFSSKHEYNQFIKGQNLRGLKMITDRNSSGEIFSYQEEFKSKEELEIANFLYLNRINYVYEKGYKVRTATEIFGQYKPDFYLPDYDIYIEHFGIDRQGNVPSWFTGDGVLSAKEKYNNAIAWKRDLHAENETVLIETYSYLKKEGILLETLRQKLEENGVPLKPMSEEEKLIEIKSKSTFEFNEFLKLLMTFTTLFKSNRLQIDKFRSTLEENGDLRTMQFFDLWKPIYEAYQTFLNDRKEIDFTDMINIATDYINSKKYKSAFKYIIIDEFQDISIGRYSLIKALLDKSPSTKLFCVGDDWQSIYRFSGSDISIFTRFAEYFATTNLLTYKRKSTIKKLENTYRFKQDLIGETSKFILKNPSQLAKNLISKIPDSNEKSVKIIRAEDEKNVADQLYDALFNLKEELLDKEESINDKSIIILGRYTHDLQKIKHSKKFLVSKTMADRNSIIKVPEITTSNIEFLTVHSSKGLEADYVFLINTNAGKYGFPSQISDDPVLHYLLSHTDEYPHSEERRLFYVALTRCRERIYLITEKGRESLFLSDLSCDDVPRNNCPSCSLGKLSLKMGKYGYFYCCDNNSQCIYTARPSVSDIHKEAIIAYRSKNISDALKLLHICENMEPSNVTILKDLVFVYNELEDYQQVEKFAKQALSKSSDDDLLKWLKNYHLSLNLHNEFLITILKKLIINKVDLGENYFLLGNIFYNSSRYDEAISAFAKAIVNRYTDVNAHYLKGECHLKLGQDSDALGCFYDAASHNFKNSKERYNILFAKLKKKNAISHLDKNVILSSPKQHIPSYEEIMIQNAIDAGLNIRFDYKKNADFTDGEISNRLVSPQEIIVVGESKSRCIKGFCFLRNEERTFAISRISNVLHEYPPI
ncbi:UvrD-helicase domain-containing protein [Chryseobacterium sp. 5_R23647]|uniref:UvrD-helicase domain-containing protein n=1 Tax=Chryseobacterium sp. 5_R23647 TaxID=2258964 RepID=UPI000E24984E|nr:UvrD-helicase domain-containing protein [Chryseobacterium sp. 5_R23647]REC42583.1 hypothetical protein DRF69_11035 [Chryseobacterium sp. 5_R23647]